MDIEEKLNRLAEMQAQADVIQLHYQNIRQSLIPEEILQQLRDVDAEYQTSIEALNAGIAELTSEIRKEVLERGDSVKGANLHAILVKGRTSWDTKALDGYAVGHPEILVFRRQGEPSVSIRRTR